MVRLLREVSGCHNYKLEGFQSHNGAIAAPIMNHLVPHRKWFQSHNGAIAAFTMNLEHVTALGFNPTMVRLLRWFLRGRLKKGKGFNPTMVRLLHLSQFLRFVT